MLRIALAALLTLLLFGCADEPVPVLDDEPVVQCKGGKCDAIDPANPERHVQIIHLDGYRPDVFKAMLENGQLPNFEYLLSRGKVSYTASTVDKSETMKVIQSYLTGRLDTWVVGWWQFSRQDMAFRNFWLDPGEVLNYALGLDFPRYPTILDVVSVDGANTIAGMSLARRGVPFNNYARPYLEGLQAVSNHTYYNQARAVMNGQLDILTRIATSDEPTPALSTMLLAPADEFAHADGIVSGSDKATHCFDRDEFHDPAIFEVIDEDTDHRYGGELEDQLGLYFTDTDTTFFGGEYDKLCVALPLMEAFTEPGGSVDRPTTHRALPEYVLAMTLVDIEIGYLIQAMRSVRYDENRERSFEKAGKLSEYMAAGRVEDSLFERTLFIMFGDHGMVDSKAVMAPLNDTGPRHPMSTSTGFIDYLNSSLGLSTGADVDPLPADAELGIDYQAMPGRLVTPYKYSGWQDAQMLAKTQAATTWATEFFGEITEALRENLHEQYWWLFFLKSAIVDPRLDDGLASVTGTAIDTLAALYLRGEPGYREAQRVGNSAFFDEHVRLVYGGGARNNAELFIPSCSSGACTWSQRASYDEIINYRGGRDAQLTLIEALSANPGVGLFFIRRNNVDVSTGGVLPDSMHIEVWDTAGSRGDISVSVNAGGEQVYGYTVENGTDPLHYGERTGFVGTYAEWNDLSVKNADYYHNVVAGIGSYMYSTNPAIGDVLVMHSQGWNFGDNRGGHGGLHRGEKLTMMMVSGPGVAGGELMSIDGHHPTVLDAAPTALAWLGYEDDALPAFAAAGFDSYMERWIASQRTEVLDNVGGSAALESALEDVGFAGLEVNQFRARLERLFQFISMSELPPIDPSRARIDGKRLSLE